ncbi:zinc dependent phospholipase C family protein [Anaerosporobacter sp.]|uniref:zinc dependent phospholipase C family protein n=1 Tax=Anaerosporobacter sp. TaxID=1872529 RepID=UPI00286F459F|nr:zinc dependent phospholipase C family protein [Anaerosporobacter sp.]
MLINTHILLADKLLFNIKGIGNWTKINHLAFYWGSIRPDIHSPFVKGTHMYDKRINEIEKVWNHAGKLFLVNRFLSSYYLGYVMHFVADFFTYVHNDEESISNLSPHFAYEKELHKEMFYADSTELNICFAGDFRSYMEELREGYFSEEHTPERDCIFIYATTLALMQWVIAPVVAKNPVCV